MAEILNGRRNHGHHKYLSGHVILRGAKFQFVDKFFKTIDKEASVLIVCDIAYGVKMLRKLLAVGHPHWSFIELRKMAPERLQDIITTTQPRVVLSSVESWVNYEYALFDVDYLIIMDAIIDPTVDLDLEQTKLIQLVSMQGIDNYVYDHECVDYSKLLEQLPSIVEYLSKGIRTDGGHIKRKAALPHKNMEAILKFESKSCYFDQTTGSFTATITLD